MAQSLRHLAKVEEKARCVILCFGTYPLYNDIYFLLYVYNISGGDRQEAGKITSTEKN